MTSASTRPRPSPIGSSRARPVDGLTFEQVVDAPVGERAPEHLQRGQLECLVDPQPLAARRTSG
jgi:hypothetical protein